MSVMSDIKIRPLERGDLHFVHKINNNDVIMRYWFEEPYEAYDELVALYDRHLHDQNERRFIIERDTGEPAGLVELVEIDYIHRRAEFQIIIAPSYQGRGYAKAATRIAVGYAFRVLNLHKVYLVVDKDNAAAVHIYERCGFRIEGLLKEEFFSNGAYRDAYRMALLQHDHLREVGPARRTRRCCATGRRKSRPAESGRMLRSGPGGALSGALYLVEPGRLQPSRPETLSQFKPNFSRYLRSRSASLTTVRWVRERS